ncbi:tetratricopeptide repeat protein 31-like isoform X2 [Labrus mixtus]|uniref:tetratricopeptide repeat protein 31-like isoform X2 n=1 Tax=Labrus mixtus TaxID=508554 RepID=UPI0029C0343B|nr:tetratricopeptide repeat protein 31-like isoform X2 [Labrus mixtus]
MESDDDDKELPDHPVLQRFLGMFDGNPGFQRILRLGLRAELESKEEIYEVQDVSQLPMHPSEYLKATNWSSDGRFIGKYTRQSSVANRVPYFTTNTELPPPASVEDQTKERDPEKTGRLLQEAKQYASKAERKRLKKQKQKEKKQQGKLDKEKPSPGTNEDGEDGACKTESKQLNCESNNSSSSDRQLASAKDTDSSDGSKEESSDRDTEDDSGSVEELDMASLFVSKAADIARRKMEQKREKKQSPVKEDSKSSPGKTEDSVIDKKDSVATSSLTFEDNIKISTDLANSGNRFASTGDYSMAVMYFTDAIKFNPTEFKLFGNRSFCFEKMQEYEKALADAELSLSMCPGWVKGLFRKGRALAGLKRYDEASQAFRDVLQLKEEQSKEYAEAAHELMRVQITQLMGFGFTREQSSNALILNGTVEKALKVLSKLNNRPGPVQNGAHPAARLVNVGGVSPVLSAIKPAPHPPQSHNAPKPPHLNKPLVPVQNMSNVKSQPQPVLNQAPRTYSTDPRQPHELFPIWVGNLFEPLTESDLKHLFNKAGVIHSVKLLSYKRCAFVNYTKQEYCDEAIRRFHGFDLNGAKIAVRYPDRIPHGIGISKSAIKAEDMEDVYTGYEYGRNAVGGGRPFRSYRHAPEYRGNYQY